MNFKLQNRMVVAWGWGLRKWGDVGQRAQTFSYKMNNFCGSNAQYGDYS